MAKNINRITEVATNLVRVFESIQFRTDGEVLEDEDFESMLHEVKMAYDDYLELKSLLVN